MRFLIAFFMAAVAATTAHARQSLDDFAALPTAWAAEISPDGSRLALGCSPRGLREVCVFNLNEGGRPQLIPAPDGARITRLYWASPTHLLIGISQFERQTTSDAIEDVEYRRLIAWNAATGGTAMLLSEFRGGADSLTDVSSILSGDDDRIAMQVTMNVSGQAEETGTRVGRARSSDFATVVFEVDLNSGRSRGEIHPRSRESVIDHVMTAEGETLADVLYDEDSDRYRIRRHGRGGQTLYDAEHAWNDRPVIHGTIDDGAALAIYFNGGRGLSRLDLTSGDITAFGDGLADADAVIDTYSGALVGFSGVDDLPVMEVADEELAGLQTALANALPEESVILQSWTPDRQRIIVAARDRGRPTTYYLFDRAAGQVSVIATEVDAFQAAELPSRRRIDYTARDGMEIPAYVTLPTGARFQDGPFPLIVMPHGGPYARDTAEYDWWAAAYASLGYVVLQPNFRGSSGHERAHFEAGFGEFGHAMIEDMIDGADLLIADAVAEDGGYCVAGASYGGYAAMMMAIEDPRVACVISFAGVADPFALLATGRGSASFTEWWERYMGSRFQAEPAHAEITPRDRAGESEAPILLIHGAEDVTVQPVQSRWMAEAAGDRARLIELEGENHYLGSTVARQALLNESAAFLAEHLPVE